MTKKDKNLTFRLVNVKESQFNLDLRSLKLDDLNDGDNINVGLGSGLSGSIEQNIIVLTLNAQYSTIDDAPIMSCSCDFTFSVNELSSYMSYDDTGKHLTVADILTNNLLSVAIGTIRGVIVVKTAGTILASFPLPIINPCDVSDEIFGNSSSITVEQTK